MQSVMNKNFAQVPARNIGRTAFDRSSGRKQNLDAGYVVPFFYDEVLPGDTKNLNTTGFIRLQGALNVPIMDNLRATFFYFFVPYRLIWTNFKKFMGERENPDDSIDYVTPKVTSPAGGWLAYSLYDYLGLPINVAGLTINNFKARAYNLIWNEWFRDQNLQDSVVVDKDDGPDTVTDYVLLKRGKRHDFFTSCLPWPQKGDAVTLPLGTSAPVIGNGKALGLTDATHYAGLYRDGSSAFQGDSSLYGANVGTTKSGTANLTSSLGLGVTTNASYSGLVADLSNATAATVNAIRQAFQGQVFLELDARGGTRYTEIVRSHFGVVSLDARLQRPEYLGGGSFPIMVNQVADTSGTTTGKLSAYAMAGGSTGGFTTSFTEHGIILGLVSINADLTYQQGIPKMDLRSTRYDFYDPVLAHLGEQAVLRKQIYAAGSATDNEVFGYQEAWAEYRYKPSEICGGLRSAYAQSLDVYHLSQDFSSHPVLNSTFIQDSPPIDRIVRTSTEKSFIMDFYWKYIDVRPMPKYSIPGLIDHL